ncbi:uncharacterized protein LOC132038567 [Lycium ferocissimum]|uniref:uncharacterized protein LOC132038567 n=1 Tax=Lycium ferocissimum TaxID=112874 RepID=UPI002816899D|nr:uncharacterized protein LOC132038567 [Lycium ferocissimum]
MMNKILLWNIRLVNTQQSFERLTNLNRRNRYSIIGLMEPFEDAEQVERFRRKLGMETTFVNISGKIWLFLSEDVQGSVEIDNEQQITLKLFHQSLNCNIVLTVVYASCDAGERRMLWDSISQVSNLFDLPWLVGGDFNVISTEEEKLGGLLVLYNEVADFNHCLSSCGLQDLGYVGSTYTWWNGRDEEACIFKKLDRMVCNDKLLDVMPTMKVTHLIKKGSNHSPLELEFSTTTEVIIKPFKFLNFWVQHESFHKVIKQHWCIDFEGNPFTKFHHKLKKVNNALRNWSKNTYGNIFQQIASLEEVIKVHEEQFESSPIVQNRERLHKGADLSRFLHLEKLFWKLKSGLTWFQDGDRNSKFFHAYVKRRRKKLRVDNIQNANGNWLTNQEEISQARLFFQSCWEIVKLDVVDMVKAFFVGQELPRFITHTNLILIPKKEQMKSFSDPRPISLSNFTNKIISRVLHERLVKLLPGLIYENQSAFVKGRSIMENVLLTQEIVRDISKITKIANVVVKLDMTKAYDRVSWLFLTKVLRKFGFSEVLIDMVFSLLSNIWYSVLLNGQAHGFFKSSKGVKQGDPLSPTLFILVAEALSRGLNALYKNPRFVEYGMPKGSPRINHLSYADDTILFVSADQYSVKLMMRVLNRYEKVSGQLVNLNKSAFYVHEKVQSGLVSRLKQITGIRQGLFPFTYLGCPIFYSRNKISHYDTVVKKIAKRVNAWQGRLLSYRGRATLISHVLQNEGGLGFRSLFEVSNAFFCKLWWNLRIKPSLWSSFMINKYCKKLHPVIAQAKGASPIWRTLVIVTELVEHQIWWQVKKGDSSFWFDNSTNLGALYHVLPEDSLEEEIEVQNFASTEGWNAQVLIQYIPKEYVKHVIETIPPPQVTDELDKSWWLLEKNGSFSVKSAWEYVRHREVKMDIYNQMWRKHLPFKFSFTLGRAWRYKMPVDDVIYRRRIQLASKCWCYTEPKQETMSHIFLTSPTASKLWRMFANFAAYPKLKTFPSNLPAMIQYLEEIRPRIRYQFIYWDPPPDGMIKCNIDGASKGNPGRSSYGYCLRNSLGDLIYVEGKEIHETTNMEAEVMAIKEAIYHCVANNIQEVLVETDSMVMKNIIEGTWEIPWQLIVIVEDIKHLITMCEVKFQHVKREGNSLADYIANQAILLGSVEYKQYTDLPSQGRRLLNLDKQHYPNIRSRTLKIG